MKMNLASWLLGLMLVTSLFSCNKDDEEISTEVGIIGVWTVQSADVTLDGKSLDSYIEETINQMKSQFGEQYSDEMGVAIAESFESFDMTSGFEGNTIEFKSENNIVVVTDEDGSEEGTWSLSGNNLTVTFDGVPETFEVRNMTKSSASLHASFEGEGMDQQSAMMIESIINLKK